MTSRSLYLAKWKENIKRRSWTVALCLAVLFLLLPVRNAVELNSGWQTMEAVAQMSVSQEELDGYFANMQNVFAQHVGISCELGLCMAFFAILFAVQGFSFLYSKQKMDLYMSVPVSGPKHFFLLWGNGILLFVLCYLPNLLLSLGIGAVFGVVNSGLLAGTAIAFLVNLLAFTAMYHVALLASLLTGNVLTALLGCLVLFIYEGVVRLLFGGLKSTFFVSYCRADQDRLSAMPWLTPFLGYMNLADRTGYQGGVGAAYVFAGYSEKTWNSALGEEICLLGLAAVAVGLLCFWVFRKRKTESYYQAVAFGGLKPVLEFFLLVPFAVSTAMLAQRMAADQNLFLAAGALGGLVVGHCVIQLVYERDLRAVFGQKAILAVSGVAAALVLCIFRFDLVGFDRFLPDKEKIESVSVTLEADYNNFGQYNFDNRSVLNTAKRILAKMESGDPKTIDATLAMVSAWQEAGMPRHSGKLDGAGWEDSKCFVVRYHLTGGRNVYRRFYVAPALTADALDALMDDASYKQFRYQLYQDAFEQAVDTMKVIYFDGKQELLYTMDKKQLLETFRRDFENYDYRMLDTHLPCGSLRFAMPESKNGRRYDWNYPVYESFADTIALLGQNDIAAGGRESILRADEVKEIRIGYYVYEDAQDMPEDALFTAGEVPAQNIVATFDEPEQIAQILRGLYPQSLMDVAGEEFKYVQLQGEYDVTVSLTQEAVRNHCNADGQFFLKGCVPEFVKKKIRESAVRG